jgi:hypothetical protein
MVVVILGEGATKRIPVNIVLFTNLPFHFELKIEIHIFN